MDVNNGDAVVLMELRKCSTTQDVYVGLLKLSGEIDDEIYYKATAATPCKSSHPEKRFCVILRS